MGAAYSDLKSRALEQSAVLVGTPGSVEERTVSGRKFWYRQFYDAEGKRGADYLGPAEDADAAARAQAMRERIADANALLRDARDLARHGYVRAEPRVSAILAALANGGLFRAGAVLVGSHAYGAILNDLGVRATAYMTEDVDIARGAPLDIALPEGESFETILASSRVPLLGVPGFGRRAATTSFKVKGGRLRVDLLAATSGTEISIKPVPELRSHAAGLPFLKYLLEEAAPGIVLGKENVTPVRLPRPERMAWHKMLVAALRGVTRDKRAKDLEQAATLFAVISVDDAGALEDAYAALPRGTRSRLEASASHVLELVEAARQERAADVLRKIAGV